MTQGSTRVKDQVVRVHGGTVTIAGSRLSYHPDPLMAALRHRATTVDLSPAITLTSTEPTRILCGQITLARGDSHDSHPLLSIPLAPGQTEEFAQLANLISQGCQTGVPRPEVTPNGNETHNPAYTIAPHRQAPSPGNSPADPPVVAIIIAGEFTTGDPASLTAVHTLEWTPTRRGDVVSWRLPTDDQAALRRTLSALCEVLRRAVVVAENAQPLMLALHGVATDWGTEPDEIAAGITFGCLTALSRAMGTTPRVALSANVVDTADHLEALHQIAAKQHTTVTDAAELWRLYDLELGEITTREEPRPVLRTSDAVTIRAAEQPSVTETRNTPSTNDASRPRRDSAQKPAPLWSRVATPDTIPEPNANADKNNPLYGQKVTLSGDFTPYDKGELWEGIAAAGGTVLRNVTKKTTVFVTGSWAKKTSKHKKAEEYAAQGQNIAMWDATQLFAVLGFADDSERSSLEDPPF